MCAISVNVFISMGILSHFQRETQRKKREKEGNKYIEQERVYLWPMIFTRSCVCVDGENAKNDWSISDELMKSKEPDRRNGCGNKQNKWLRAISHVKYNHLDRHHHYYQTKHTHTENIASHSIMMSIYLSMWNMRVYYFLLWHGK